MTSWPIAAPGPFRRPGPGLARVGLAAGLAAALVVALGIAVPVGVAAHGPVPDAGPTPATLLLGWTFEPLVALPLLAAVALWLVGVGRVDLRHPGKPVPRRRTAAFLAGLAAIAVALLSGIGTYDTSLFSVHMVQHILLTLVAAPLIAYSGPITLALRAAGPGGRRRWLLALLHARIVRLIAHPIVAWLAFAIVMWGSHFSPLFDVALENESVHVLEHGLFLSAGLLFWWPAMAVDPGPWRMAEPARIMYVFLQMPQNTFLSVAILFAGRPLYPHYASLAAEWLPDPLADQQLAGAIMWLLGDGVFLSAVLLLVATWMRREDRDVAAADRRADAGRARLRERETALASRLAGPAPADSEDPIR